MMCKVKPEKTDSAALKMPKSCQSQTKKKPVKKTFFRHTKKKEPVSKDQGKTKALLPPKDAQQFSANWKMLLEVFKSNPPLVKKQPFQQNSKKEVHKKPTKDISEEEEEDVATHKKLAKDLSKAGNDAKPTQINSGKAGKDSAVPSKSQVNSGKAGKDSAVPSKSQVNSGKAGKDSAVPSKSQVNSGKAGKDSAVPSKSQVNGKGSRPSGTEQPKAKKRKQSSVQTDRNVQLNKKKKVEEVEEKKPTKSDMWFDDVDPDDIEATVGTEAADIMRKIQGTQKTDAQTTEKALVKDRGFEGLTKAVAMDCEMVGVGPDGEDSIVARVSLVNQFGKCIYDKYVKPTEKVTDYRTAVSGIRPDDIKNGENVKTVQKEVAEILQGRTLVGHAIHNDLKRIRDTQKYKPFKKIVKSGRPSLKLLCREILSVKVQQGEHSSVQDAQATMRLYTMAKKHWEAEIKASHNNPELTKKTNEPRKPKSPKHKLT